MSASLTKLICSTILAITGLVVVKNISGSSYRKINFMSLILMIILISIPILNYGEKYSYMSTLTIFVISVFVYKYMINISFSKSTICSAILYISLFLLEFIFSQILVLFISALEIRNSLLINVIFNIIFSIILLFIYNSNRVKNSLVKFINKIEDRKSVNYVTFFLLLIIAFSIILYTVTLNYNVDSIFNISFIVPFLFFILVIILINERNEYDKLSDEYDSLFNYVKVFEDWIEEEQFIRHEYKNQLAVLRCMTKEKKVKEKIDSIISENINIDNQMINELKSLPNGGLKGLLYYKIIVARNKKINISTDISKSAGEILGKLSEDQIKVLSKILGVYCDNAIEAASETRKKIILIEIYEYDGNVKVVISNTFSKSKNISRRNEKGFSTKGEGRGNGLYFANKLISKSKWIEESQDIIDN